MSESYGGGVVVSGPAVSIDVDLSLEYLRENAVDSSAVIGALKSALANSVNSTSTTGTITANDLAEMASAVPGVLAVLATAIDGGSSFTGSGGARLMSYCRIPSTSP